MDVSIRPLKPAEYKLLDDFLYLSIFQEEGKEPVPRSVLNDPTVRLYIQDFGSAKDDYSLCAVRNDDVLGIVWARNINGYGSIDGQTPELAIAVRPAYRGQGIGSALLAAMLQTLERAGYKSCSLSVQKLNRAHKLYFRFGFDIYREDKEEYVLIRNFGDLS